MFTNLLCFRRRERERLAGKSSPGRKNGRGWGDWAGDKLVYNGYIFFVNFWGKRAGGRGGIAIRLFFLCIRKGRGVFFALLMKAMMRARGMGVCDIILGMGMAMGIGMEAYTVRAGWWWHAE